MKYGSFVLSLQAPLRGACVFYCGIVPKLQIPLKFPNFGCGLFRKIPQYSAFAHFAQLRLVPPASRLEAPADWRAGRNLKILIGKRVWGTVPLQTEYGLV